MGEYKDGLTLLETLRRDRDEAKKRLEKIKDRELVQWKGESFEHFRHRMHLHRKRREHVRQIVEGYDGRIKDAKKRKQKRKQENKADKNPYDRNGGRVVPFDSTVDGVVEWIAYELTAARGAGWTGYAFSGWRSPEKSEGICYAMCGQPSCPGRCAGRSSKHSESGNNGGAVDITNPTQFEEIAHRLGLRLHNELTADLPHMSATGH